MKYPEECPVFRINGIDREASPSFAIDGSLRGSLVFVHDEDRHGLYLYGPSVLEQNPAQPLTRAARELLAWSRQS